MIQVFDQIKFFHRSGYTHGDVRPANILILADGKPCLIDFVTATELGRKIEWIHGTILYMANDLLVKNATEPFAFIFKQRFDLESFAYAILDCADVHFIQTLLRECALSSTSKQENIEFRYFESRKLTLGRIRSVPPPDHFSYPVIVSIFFKFYDRLMAVKDDLTENDYVDLRVTLKSK